MAVRLGEHVVCGEIHNTSHYSVHGWIQLRGRKHPILLQLTGDCEEDLKGRHIRFEARSAQDEEQQDEPFEEEDAFPFLATQQIGPTGSMTAARRVKVADCPPGELYLRCKMDEPPPMEWKQCLYLEWFSQNGRVVVELADPLIEFVEEDEEEEEKGPGRSSKEPSPPGKTSGTEAPPEADPPGPDIEAVPPAFDADRNAVEDGEGEEALPEDEPEAWDEDDPLEEDEADDEDPYGLFPEGLNDQFESEASELDRALGSSDEGSRVMYEMELMDELIESGDGVPLDEIFDGPLKLPRPEQLGDEEEAETALKTLLAQLALFGIALDVCEHFTPRDAYRLLLEEICPEQTAYPELRNTQWVQHFMTSEFCPECEAEFDREYEESEQKRKENPEGDSAAGEPEDDVPF